MKRQKKSKIGLAKLPFLNNVTARWMSEIPTQG